MNKQIVFLFMLLQTSVASAQNPNWSFNSANYQQSMTFTAFLNVNGVTLTSDSDQVAAFVGEEIRGLASIQYVPSANKYLAYLTVFSNTNGETISFKIYQSSSNSVVTIDKTEVFAIDSNKGGVFQSYSIAKPQLNNEAKVNTYSFLGINSVSSTIGESQITITVPRTTNLSNLKAVYGISNGAKVFVSTNEQTSGVSELDYSSPVNFQVLSEDESSIKTYQVSVEEREAQIDVPIINLSSTSNFYVKNAPIEIKLTTNVEIAGFSLDMIVVDNAIVYSIVKINAFEYSFQVQPIDQGSFSVEIPANTVFNIQNKSNLIADKKSFVYDIINPYIISIKRKTPLSEITTSSALEFTVTFNEAIENLTSDDFEINTSGKITLVKENESIYTVKLTEIDGVFGRLTLNIKSSNAVKDKAENELLDYNIEAF